MKEIKEFDTFSGTDGFIIVDGETQNTPGGKLKIPNYANAAEGAVLTKTSDDIVWSVPQGGGGSDPFSDIGEWDDGKNPATKVKDYSPFPLEDKSIYIDVKKTDDGIIKHRIFFQYGGSGSNFYGPWGS